MANQTVDIDLPTWLKKTRRLISKKNKQEGAFFSCFFLSCWFCFDTRKSVVSCCKRREREGFPERHRLPANPSSSLLPYAGCCRCRLHPKAASLFTSLPTTPHRKHHLLASPPLLGCVSLSITWPPPRLQPSLSRAAAMSGLYSQGFSPARNLSPQIRSNPDVDR